MVHSPKNLINILEERALTQPNQRAYTYLQDRGAGEVHLTYSTLYAQSSQIAVKLQELKAQGQTVLLLFPPGLDYIASFFGCLQAGAIAVPTYLPRVNKKNENLLSIIQNSGAKVVLTHERIIEQTESGLKSINEAQWISIESLDSGQQPESVEIEPEHIAFLQYTSGSTAAPKGVMVSHGNLLENLWNICQRFEHTPEHSRGFIWLPPYHDMGLIGGILQPLYVGFPVVLMSPMKFIQFPIGWLEAISKYQITTSGGPNFAYALCAKRVQPEQLESLDLSSWDVAFNGAEPIRKDILDQFAEVFEPCGFKKSAFFPCYGLAESTLMVSGGDKASMPISFAIEQGCLEKNEVIPASYETQTPSKIEMMGCGRLVDHQTVAIVNPQNGMECSYNQIGEIWLQSRNVAQGYWKNPERSQDTFQATLPDRSGHFLRTGDLGFIQNNELFITGRLKDLIVIRGRNYYPTDIEKTVESSHPALQADAGAAFSVEIEGEERLVVVQEVQRTHRSVNLDVLVDGVRQHIFQEYELQLYAFVLLKPKSIPKTSSGKIQRFQCRLMFLNQTLPELGSSFLDTEESEEDLLQEDRTTLLESFKNTPSTDQLSVLEKYLWLHLAQLARLGRTRMDTQKAISMYGLDSLIAMEWKHQVENDLGLVLSLSSFLKDVSLHELAQQIYEQFRTQTNRQPVLHRQASLPQSFPLSYGQQSLWLLHQLNSNSAAYHVPCALRVKTKLETDALKNTMIALQKKHPILTARFSYSATTKQPMQQIGGFEKLDLAVVGAVSWGRETLSKKMEEEILTPFDLEKNGAFRIRVFSCGEEEFVLLVVMHHIITDFWSLTLLVDQFFKLYQAYCRGQSMSLPDQKYHFSDYVDWEKENLSGFEGKKSRDYWLQQLSEAPPVLGMPTDRIRLPEQSFGGDTFVFSFGSKLTQQIQSLALQQGTTMNQLLFAAYQALLFRYTGQSDFLIGIPASGRNRSEFSEIFGYFVNSIVLRAKPRPNQPFAEYLKTVQSTLTEALEYQDYPFSLLVEELQLERDLSRSPLFQFMFSYQKAYKHHDHHLTAFSLDMAGATMAMEGIEIESLALPHRTSQFDVTLTVGETESGLVASFEYNTDLYEHETIKRLSNHFLNLLQGIVNLPHQPLKQLPLLSENEKYQQLIQWNGKKEEVFPENSLLKWFSKTVEAFPNHKAIIFEEQSLSYQALHEQSEALAAYLGKQGIRSGMSVGVFMKPSIEMIVSIFGILKADSVYVPLDPELPNERLAVILSEANSPYILTSEAEKTELPSGAHKTIVFETDFLPHQESLQQEGISTPSRDQQSLACIIFTSGSTGIPKGVLLTHGGITNLIHSFIASYTPTSKDRVLPLTSPASASFIGEIFPLLCVGGTLVLARPEVYLDYEKLFPFIAENHVSIVSTVPTVIRGLSRYPQQCSSLRLILSGGESLDFQDVETLLDSVSIVNSYGLTETTVCSTYHPLSLHQKSVGIPIGRPIVNTDIYVLDQNLQLLPTGCAGEMFIAGDGLAQGYLNDPATTDQRFVPNPFRPETKIFKTGDRARWLADGTLEYLDRADQQIKIRGYRIEPGEIETVLKQHNAIESAVVTTYLEGKASKDKRLVAYYVTSNAGITTSELHEWLAGKLPFYMVPSVFERLEQVPLNANGKVDFKALPPPQSIRPPLAVAYLSPQSQMEQQLAAIWKQVLEVDQVGIQDNFFELGGNSMLAAQVHHLIGSEMKQKCDLIEMFKYPTIQALAQYFDSQSNRSVGEAPNARTKSMERVKAAALKRRQLTRNRRG